MILFLISLKYSNVNVSIQQKSFGCLFKAYIQLSTIFSGSVYNRPEFLIINFLEFNNSKRKRNLSSEGNLILLFIFISPTRFGNCRGFFDCRSLFHFLSLFITRSFTLIQYVSPFNYTDISTGR